MALEKLGPTFIKFGQVMSTRPDLVPPGMLIELQKLQEGVPPFPSDEAVAQLETELGQPVEKLFASFDTTPGHGMLFTDANRASREVLGGQMMSYWAEFAAHGNPGRGRDGQLPEWNDWRADAPLSMLFDTPANGGPRLASEPASREAVVRLMESREPGGAAACAMFRATFRTRVDAWADAAWLRYRDGACARNGAPRLPP